MSARRINILNGELTFPIQLRKMLSPLIVSENEDNILDEMFSFLFSNFLLERDTDIISFIERTSEQFINNVLHLLCKAGWIEIISKPNYLTMMLKKEKILQWISKEELYKLRLNYKFNSNLLDTKENDINNLVAVHCIPTANGVLHKQYVKTGIIRNGFMKASNTKFRLDSKYISKYKEPILLNIIKGLGLSRKDVLHQDVVEDLLDYYSCTDEEYCLGKNISDSRGRSIFNATTKAVNPISSKDIRACLKCKPKKLDKGDLESVYLFITELLGEKTNNIEANILIGFNLYTKRKLPFISNFNVPNTALHEVIWLERLYDALDEYHKDPNYLWDVPIELDVTSSVLAIMGLLMNHHEYLDLTNLIGDELKDAWTLKHCSRNHVKKSVTPILYGSAATPQALWKDSQLDFDMDMLIEIHKELGEGRYKDAINFKDFIISNVIPKEKFRVRIWNEEFDVYCNKFKWEVTKPTSYNIYTPNKFRSIIRETVRSIDLDAFVTYFPTLLCHNLDSQIANSICEEIDWILPNHDAFIVNPADVQDLREIYLSIIKEIYKDRKSILRNFFESIGINNKYDEKYNELSLDDLSYYSLK